MDTKGFQQGLAEAKKGAAELPGFLAKIGTGLSLAAAGEALRRFGGEMAALQRKAEDLGTGTSFLQGVEKLATKFGGSAEQADAALQKLLEKIGQARTEGGEAEALFNRFGIALYDTAGQARTNEEVFKSIADAYAHASDAATKAALAEAFFAKTGKEVNNILAMGGKGLDEYTAKAEAAGKIISAREVAATAATWKDFNAGLKIAGGWFEWLAGKAAYALQFIVKMVSAIAASPGGGWAKNLAEDMKKLQAQETERGNRSDDQAAKQAAQATTLGQLAEQRQKLLDAQLGDEARLAALLAQQRDIQGQMQGLDVRSVEFKKLELSFIEKGAEARKIQLGIQQQQNREAEKLAGLEKRRQEILQAIADKRAEKLFLSREELRGVDLATVNPAKRRQFAAQQKDETEISALEKLSEQHRLAGNFEYARRLNLYIERRLAALTLVKQDERFPFRAEVKQLAEIQQQAGQLPPGARAALVAQGVAIAVPQAIAGAAAGQANLPDPLAKFDAMAADLKALRNLSEGNGLAVKPKFAR